MLFAALGGNFGQNSRVQQATIIDNTPDFSRWMNVIGLFLYEVKFFFAAGINTTWSKHKLWHYISGAQTSLIVNGLSCSVGRWNERIYRITDGRL